MAQEGSGRKRIGLIDNLLEMQCYGDLQRRANNQPGWKDWLSGTLMRQSIEEEEKYDVV